MFSSKGGTFIFEIYYDWSCKIIIPIGCSSDDQREDFKDLFHGLGVRSTFLDDFQIADGTSICSALFGGLKLFADIAKKYSLKEKDYAFCTEFENSGDLILAFWGDKFKDYIRANGIPSAHKEINRSEIEYLRNGTKVNFSDLAASYLLDYIGAAFGYRSDSIAEIISESNHILIGDE